MIIMSRMSSDAMTFTLPSPATWTGALSLPEMGVLQGVGPDTASFLHGQLSQDVLHLDAHQARLAAYCSAKGRMLATSACRCSCCAPRPRSPMLGPICA
jgi:folate-binding Fe-S cluster repair protein YgfZ